MVTWSTFYSVSDIEMKKFGLIGGTSWYATVAYYTSINQGINDIFNDNTNPPLYVSTLNQKEIHDLQKAGDWQSIADIYIDKSSELQNIGVEGLAFCANTPHKIYAAVSQKIAIPIIHITDSVAKEIKDNNHSTVALLGTRFTMQEDFFKHRLLHAHGINTVVPDQDTQLKIQEYFYQELSVGVFKESTKAFFEEVIASLMTSGAEAVILGCTEFPLLLKDTSSHVTLIDSLQCHCRSIIDFVLAND